MRRRERAAAAIIARLSKLQDRHPQASRSKYPSRISAGVRSKLPPALPAAEVRRPLVAKRGYAFCKISRIAESGLVLRFERQLLRQSFGRLDIEYGFNALVGLGGAGRQALRNGRRAC